MTPKKKLLMSAFLLVLSSCAGNPSAGKPQPKITFDHLGPMHLAVGSVQKVSTTPGRQNVPLDFYVDLDEVLNRYIDTRLQALGGSRTLTVNVQDMRVEHTQKDSENKVAGFLGVAKIDTYHITARFDLRTEDADTGATQHQSFSVERKINVLEHVSIAEREQKQVEGVRLLFDQVDATMLEILKNNFAL